MDTTKLNDIVKALREAEYSSTPTTTKTVTTFTETLTAHVDTLKEWVQDLENILGDIEGGVEDLNSADTGDRDDAHSELVSHLGALLDELPGARDNT